MEADREPWAIVGFGLGGALLAAELGGAGIPLRVADRDRDLVAALAGTGGVQLDSHPESFVSVDLATTELGEAVDGARVIIVCTLANDHEAVARALSPHLVEGQAILLIQGHFGGTLAVRRALSESGHPNGVILAEMDMFPFFGGRLSATRLTMAEPRSRVQVATLPGHEVDRLLPLIQVGFPMARGAPNVLHTGFHDLSPLVHSTAMLLNIGLVQGDGEYRFYLDAMHPGVVNLIEAADRERLAVAEAYGVQLPTLFDYYRAVHQVDADSLLDLLHTLGRGTFRFAPAPKSLGHRYLQQDLAMSVVGWSEMARIAGLEVPVLDAMIDMAGVVAGTDFRTSGRRASSLGLDEARGVDDVLGIVGDASSPDG